MAKSSSFNLLNWIYKHFKNDTSHMLIVTGGIGYVLSSLAQIGAIMVNDKVSPEKKTFLIPQEFVDGAINLFMFLFITLGVKKSIGKLVSTGKLLPKGVKNELLKNYKDRIGKIDFDIDKLKGTLNNNVFQEYNSYKDYASTVGTLGATLISANVMTPFVRNAVASNVQNNYKQNKQKLDIYRPVNYSGNMKI